MRLSFASRTWTLFVYIISFCVIVLIGPISSKDMELVTPCQTSATRAVQSRRSSFGRLSLDNMAAALDIWYIVRTGLPQVGLLPELFLQYGEPVRSKNCNNFSLSKPHVLRQELAFCRVENRGAVGRKSPIVRSTVGGLWCGFKALVMRMLVPSSIVCIRFWINFQKCTTHIWIAGLSEFVFYLRQKDYVFVSVCLWHCVQSIYLAVNGFLWYFQGRMPRCYEQMEKILIASLILDFPGCFTSGNKPSR